LAKYRVFTRSGPTKVIFQHLVNASGNWKEAVNSKTYDIRVLEAALETALFQGRAIWVSACIEDPEVIEKILNHYLNAKSACLDTNRLPETRAPPQQGSLDL